jgi:adenylate cyclase
MTATELFQCDEQTATNLDTDAAKLAYEQLIRYGEDFQRIYAAERVKRRELVTERNLLNTILNSVPDGLVVMDSSFVIQRANQTFANLIMTTPDALVGRAIREVMLTDGLDRVLKTIREQGETSETFELSIVQPVRPDEEVATLVFKRRSFRLNVGRLQDPHLDGWVFVIHDQTQEKQISDAFDRYVIPEAAERLTDKGTRLGGEVVAGSVLFADIRDFTSLAEDLSSTEVVGMLNHYFATIEPIVRQAGGWVAKFGGDSLLAVFGVPTFQPDHAWRAVQAAAGIQKALAEFNRQQRILDGPQLRVGIGIAAGEMVAGNIGSPERMEYTVIGDTVNLAARIEELTKEWQVDILISDTVYNQVQNHTDATLMPTVAIRGREKPAQLYALNRVNR